MLFVFLSIISLLAVVRSANPILSNAVVTIGDEHGSLTFSSTVRYSESGGYVVASEPQPSTSSCYFLLIKCKATGPQRAVGYGDEVLLRNVATGLFMTVSAKRSDKSPFSHQFQVTTSQNGVESSDFLWRIENCKSNGNRDPLLVNDCFKLLHIESNTYLQSTTNPSHCYNQMDLNGASEVFSSPEIIGKDKFFIGSGLFPISQEPK